MPRPISRGSRPVYTLPDRAAAAMRRRWSRRSSRELLARGKRKLFLTTDVANPTSNAIYARIGFVPETDDCGFDFVDAEALSAMAAPRFFVRDALVACARRARELRLPEPRGASRDRASCALPSATR